MNKLSISVVVYNSNLDVLKLCLESLESACKKLTNYLVKVDIINNYCPFDTNDQLDTLAEFFSTSILNARVINSPFNTGYGSGNNLSIFNNKDSRYHLIINPDVFVDTNSIVESVYFLDKNSGTSMVTPRILDANGNLQYLSKENPTALIMIIRALKLLIPQKLFTILNTNFQMYYSSYDDIIYNIQYPSGCFMFCRQSSLLKVKGFDHRYFLHYEDADLGREISKIGSITYLPTVIVHHIWSRDTHKSIIMYIITISSGIKYLFKWNVLKFFK